MNGPVETSSNVARGAFAYRDLEREHDRLRTLFDITNALVSKLGRDELLSAISEQLSKIIRHDYAMLTLRNETGGLDLFALHSTGPQLVEPLKEPSFESAGRPAGEVLATGKPVVVRDIDIDRYPALRR